MLTDLSLLQLKMTTILTQFQSWPLIADQTVLVKSVIKSTKTISATHNRSDGPKSNCVEIYCRKFASLPLSLYNTDLDSPLLIYGAVSRYKLTDSFCMQTFLKYPLQFNVYNFNFSYLLGISLENY
jgi:hypothetical protein